MNLKYFNTILIGHLQSTFYVLSKSSIKVCNEKYQNQQFFKYFDKVHGNLGLKDRLYFFMTTSAFSPKKEYMSPPSHKAIHYKNKYNRH